MVADERTSQAALRVPRRGDMMMRAPGGINSASARTSSSGTADNSESSSSRSRSTILGNNHTSPGTSSVEVKLASLSYSFSQQMPAPRKKKSPFDRNFPELQSAEASGNDSTPVDGVRGSTRKVWETQSDTFPRKTTDRSMLPIRSRISGTSLPNRGKEVNSASTASAANPRVATAAEIVAHRKETKVTQVASRGPNAELELFSKLVPTTSAVPRSAKGPNSVGVKTKSAFGDGPLNLRGAARGKPQLGLGASTDSTLDQNSTRPTTTRGDSDGNKVNSGLVRLRHSGTTSTTLPSTLRNLRSPPPSKSVVTNPTVATKESIRPRDVGTAVADTAHREVANIDFRNVAEIEVTSPAKVMIVSHESQGVRGNVPLPRRDEGHESLVPRQNSVPNTAPQSLPEHVGESRPKLVTRAAPVSDQPILANGGRSSSSGAISSAMPALVPENNGNKDVLSNGTLGMPPGFKYSASSLFDFQQHVDTINIQSVSEADGHTPDRALSGQDKSGSMDMRMFSTSSPLYISPAIEAGSEFVVDTDEMDADENLLPPLPSADDDKFESVLRRMGWTP